MEKASSSYIQKCCAPRLLRAGENLLFSFGHYKVYGEINKGCLEKLSFEGEDKEGERGLIDGLLELFEGKGPEQIKGIQLREAESFLRRENHEIAFDINAPFTSWFAIKDQFIRAIHMAQSPIVCTCFKVSYKAVEDELIKKTDLKALIAKLKISTACGACLEVGKGKRFSYLNDIYHGVVAKKALNYYESEEYQKLDRSGFSSLGGPNEQESLNIYYPGRFKDLGLLKKVQLANLVLEKKIRPFLRRDGGDVELIDIEQCDIFVSYQGSCQGCAAADKGTLEFMTETLIKEFQEPQINVIVDQ